jgi:hypothetical protein
MPQSTAGEDPSESASPLVTRFEPEEEAVSLSLLPNKLSYALVALGTYLPDQLHAYDRPAR